MLIHHVLFQIAGRLRHVSAHLAFLELEPVWLVNPKRVLLHGAPLERAVVAVRASVPLEKTSIDSMTDLHVPMQVGIIIPAFIGTVRAVIPFLLHALSTPCADAAVKTDLCHQTRLNIPRD